MDVENLLGIVNRGSAKLHINVVTRELFWLCAERDITLGVEWVPRELNSLADELSKFLIPSGWMLSRRVFRRLEERWGSHSVDMFASDADFQGAKFYSLHSCRGSAGCDAFVSAWGGEETFGVNCPYRILGRVWRKLRSYGARATILVPPWESATWWGLLAPDGVHLCDEVIDWVWLDKV